MLFIVAFSLLCTNESLYIYSVLLTIMHYTYIPSNEIFSFCWHGVLFTSDKGGRICFCCTPAFVCLSVYVQDYSNVCMNLDEMLRVNRCRDIDELVNFWADTDHSLDAGTRFLPPILYRLWNIAALPSLAYFSAISVSICAKLARSILMTDRNTATDPSFFSKNAF